MAGRRDRNEESHDLDEVAAHLDRGWECIEKGDIGCAELAARRILELDPECPEGHLLRGAIAGAHDQLEEALAHYRRATALDPAWIDPLLYAAEAHLGTDGNLEEALRYCRLALDLAEEEDEYVDALVLRAEIELMAGDVAAARATIGELPPTPLPDWGVHLRAGRIALEAEVLDLAMHHLKQALERSSTPAEVEHALALVHERRGEQAEMVRMFQRVLESDIREPPVPWALSRERFDEVSTQTLADLPEKMRALLENVPILASDRPSAEQVAEGIDPRVLGLFAGTPATEKSLLDPPRIDHISLFQRNIERVARTPERVEEEIRITLVHEAGHFFGLSEEELDDMGLG